MAAEMTADPEAFVRALMPVNLPLAGECAAVLRERLSATLQDELRWALVQRSQDTATDNGADLRARIVAALALGPLGDPRFAAGQTPDKKHLLLPPMVPITGGTYTIGSNDEQDDEKPAHPIEVAPFQIGVFPITNAEYK